MGLDLDFTDGQTPLDEDEKEGLIITTITTRGELCKALTLWNRSIEFSTLSKFSYGYSSRIGWST